MGTKNNPGQYDCYTKAAPDEPIFTLRAKDTLSPILVDLWVTIRENEWYSKFGTVEIPEDYQAKLDEARLVANQMRHFHTQIYE